MKFMNYQWILTLQYNINKKSFFFKIVLLHHSEDFIYRSLSSKMEKYFSRHSFQSLQCWWLCHHLRRPNVDLKRKKKNHFLLVTQKYDVKTYRFQYIICDWYVLKISVNFPTRGAKNRSKWFEFNREWSVFILNSILYLFFVCHQF